MDKRSRLSQPRPGSEVPFQNRRAARSSEPQQRRPQLSSPAGVELGRASMPAVAAFHRIQSLPACQQALPGRRLRGFAGAGSGYPFGRPVCLYTATQAPNRQAEFRPVPDGLLPEPPRNRRLGTRFMFRKRPKIVVLMQHPATTWRGTFITPKKSALARLFCFTIRPRRRTLA